MKTTAITGAFELLRSEVSQNHLSTAEYRTKMNIAEDAQAELAECQRLISVVQGFIKDNKLTDDGTVMRNAYSNCGDATLFICDLCDIVGYHEEL